MIERYFCTIPVNKSNETEKRPTNICRDKQKYRIKKYGIFRGIPDSNLVIFFRLQCGEVPSPVVRYSAVFSGIQRYSPVSLLTVFIRGETLNTLNAGKCFQLRVRCTFFKRIPFMHTFCLDFKLG